MTKRTFCKASSMLVASASFGIIPKRVHEVHVFTPITTRSGLDHWLELSPKQLSLPAVSEHIQSILGVGVIKRSDAPIDKLQGTYPIPSRTQFVLRSRNHADDFLHDRHGPLTKMAIQRLESIPIIDCDIEENETVEFCEAASGTDAPVHVVMVMTCLKVATGQEWEFQLNQKQMEIPEVAESVRKKLGPGPLLHPSSFNFRTWWGHDITFRNHAHDFDNKVYSKGFEWTKPPPAIDVDIDESQLEGIDKALAYRSA